MRRLAAGLFVLALGAAAARADVIVTVTKVTPPYGAGYPAAFTNSYSGFVVTFTTTGAAEKMWAVDFTDSNTQVRGCLGALHQRWTYAGSDANLATSAGSVWGTSKDQADSHFLGLEANLVWFASPTEDNCRAGSPLGNTAGVAYGLGTCLKGAWAWPGADEPKSYDIAYLVVPNGVGVQMRAQVQTDSGTFNVVAVVPEPGTALLLAAGAAGALAGRRRRRRRPTARARPAPGV